MIIGQALGPLEKLKAILEQTDSYDDRTASRLFFDNLINGSPVSLKVLFEEFQLALLG